MAVIDSQVHVYEANTLKRPWQCAELARSPTHTNSAPAAATRRHASPFP